MSDAAPWIAIAIDTFDSEMFDDSAHGERLAWVCILFHAKAQGRAGKVKFRDKTFAEKYRLSLEAVSGMVDRARRAGALTVDDNGVATVVNWSRYQDPKRRSGADDNRKPDKQLAENDTHFTKTSATEDRGQRTETHQRSPTTNTRDSGGSGVSKKRRSGDLDRAVLGSLLLYEAWIDQERRLKHGLVKSQEDAQLALALRTKALGDPTITEPVGFIKATLKLKQTKPGEAWGRVSGKHEDASKAERRPSAPSPVAELIQHIGARE